MASLTPMEIKTSDERLSGGTGMKLLKRYYYFGVVILPFVYLLFSSDKDAISGGTKNHKVCEQMCSDRREQRYEHYNGRDILETQDLLNQVADDTKALIEKLNVDYGEKNFKEIFLGKDGKIRPFVPLSEKSTSALRRKLMIKVLSAQKSLMKKESSFSGCDCINGDIGLPGSVKRKGSEDFLPPLDTSFEEYIWATGGHSASAGHGNLYNESYTAFMERDVKDIFGSIGIDFQARNYAMGGTGSASEMAMCWEEIFGNDVDFFSWDYGMTDAGYPWRFMHYVYSGASSPGRPAFMGITVREGGQMDEMTQHLEDNGVPIFLQKDSLWSEMQKGIPDTFGLSTAEINAMPEFVRNFKCNDVIEKGEPFCEEEKYTKGICDDRHGKAPWHPGVKSHAMVGHALAFFLLDNLLDALKELIDLEYDSVDELLLKFLKEEDDVYKNQILKADFQSKAGKLYYLDDEDKEYEGIIEPSAFFSSNSMCHTARLPAQSRYLGYLTNTDKVGGPTSWGKETYELGLEEKDASRNSKTMQLVWTDDKMHEHNCEVPVNIDHKDSFFSTGNGWNSLTFPNEAERSAYNYNPKELKGIVVLVFVKCDWGKCEEAYLGPKDLSDNQYEMKINGIPVEKLLNIQHDALVAKHKDGINFPPSANNDYKFEIKVNDPSKHVKISSFIVY